ncbi:MAG: 3'-5' exonuclease [Desulfobulbaceae bacterium]|nr:MAG: 3'-5' exonuclease [Desulfobulbaceae bacterium]
MLRKLLGHLGLAPPAHPTFAENWRYFKELSLNKPLADYEFIVFDTELTGLERHDEIVSIGAVRIRNLQIMVGDTFYVKVKPQKKLPKKTTLIHRITPQEIENAPPLSTVLPKFIAYCGKSLLVGHYIGLDIAYLNQAYRHHYGAPVSNFCLDTMRMAQTYTEMQWQLHLDHLQTEASASYSLAALNTRYKLPEFTHHNAYEDALQTAYLFIFLVKKMKPKGVISLRDFLKIGQTWRIFF